MTLSAEPDCRPRLRPDVELIGEYQGSGYEEPRFLAKRADGQMVALSPLLYLVATHLRDGDDPAVVATRVGADYGRGVSGENITYLVEARLRPLGLVAASGEGSPVEPSTPRADILHLTARAAMLPPRPVNVAAGALRFLFLPPVVFAVLAAMVIGDVWLVRHGIGAAFEATLLEPLWMLALIAGILVSSLFHELGHAAACRYGGAKPGVIGVGLYLIWPAFYTDVTDSYRLSRVGRLRTDLGGIYFNLIFAVGTFALYGATGWEPLLMLVLFQHIEIVHQFMPVLRLDGYYVVSDLAGVPDLFNRVGPIARSIGRRRSTSQPALADLQPRARRIITAWLVITAPVLVINFGLLVLHGPRIFTTAGTSLRVQFDTLTAAVDAGAWTIMVLSLVSAILVALPIVGITIIVTKLGRETGRRTVRWAAVQPRSRVPVASIGALSAAALLGSIWT